MIGGSLEKPDSQAGLISSLFWFFYSNFPVFFSLAHLPPKFSSSQPSHHVALEVHRSPGHPARHAARCHPSQEPRARKRLLAPRIVDHLQEPDPLHILAGLPVGNRKRLVPGGCRRRSHPGPPVWPAIQHLALVNVASVWRPCPRIPTRALIASLIMSAQLSIYLMHIYNKRLKLPALRASNFHGQLS